MHVYQCLHLRFVVCSCPFQFLPIMSWHILFFNSSFFFTLFMFPFYFITFDQSKTLRTITSAPFNASNLTLHKGLNSPCVKQVSRVRYTIKAQSSTQTPSFRSSLLPTSEGILSVAWEGSGPVNSSNDNINICQMAANDGTLCQFPLFLFPP